MPTQECNGALDIRVIVAALVGMVDVVVNRGDHQDAPLARTDLDAIGLVAPIPAESVVTAVRHMQHVPEVVIRAAQVGGVEEDVGEIGFEMPLVEVRIVPDDFGETPRDVMSCHGYPRSLCELTFEAEHPRMQIWGNTMSICATASAGESNG